MADQPIDGQHFPYRVDTRWKPLFAAVRLKPSDGVRLGEDGNLYATYGRFGVTTPLSNVNDTKVTGPHRWYTAVGPRLSFADDGLTFGTNSEAGLCIGFATKIPRVIGLRDHSALWVSVAEPQALADALAGFS